VHIRYNYFKQQRREKIVRPNKNVQPLILVTDPILTVLCVLFWLSDNHGIESNSVILRCVSYFYIILKTDGSTRVRTMTIERTNDERTLRAGTQTTHTRTDVSHARTRTKSKCFVLTLVGRHLSTNIALNSEPPYKIRQEHASSMSLFAKENNH
jgi:hypothetical protein